MQNPILINGNLTVDGNIIIIRHEGGAAHIEQRPLIPLANLVGTDGVVYPHSLRVPGNLIIPSYRWSDSATNGRATFAVSGSILAMSEIVLDE